MEVALSGGGELLVTEKTQLLPASIKAIISTLVLWSAVSCATIDFDQPKSASYVMQDVSATEAGKATERWAEINGGKSGFYPLIEGMDALGARLRMLEMAQKSVDLQYFLMKNDTAGAVMTKAMLDAANRGVRVRLLLDDVFTTAPDRTFLLMHQHPNIDVRIFNPISRWGLKAINYVGHFKQANRRMHNKSFTVDNSISIVGGRNIADEYFQLKDDSVFVDFDMLIFGPVVKDISASFDNYWNHERALPIEHIAKNKKGETLEQVMADVSERLDGIYAEVYNEANESKLLQDLIARRIPLYPADARVIVDNPDKLINDISREHMDLANDLREVMLSAEKEIILITPYYVPGDTGVELVRKIVKSGVKMTIITNSLASNNHVPVHGAYSRYRKAVIKAGAQIYEARATSARVLSEDGEGPDNLTLHTKVFLIDNRYIFVGSVNLDPRSIEINAEMGLLVDSAEMVGNLVGGAQQKLDGIFYRVILNDKDKLEWHAIIDGQKVVKTIEPDTSWFRRFSAWGQKIVPESQL
ncbi:MAG: phospholipase D family protein [Pseudomonadales bacterium]